MIHFFKLSILILRSRTDYGALSQHLHFTIADLISLRLQYNYNIKLHIL